MVINRIFESVTGVLQSNGYSVTECYGQGLRGGDTVLR
jgi:hypothetical protein